MADETHNGTQPKLKPEKTTVRAHNFKGGDANLASVPWNIQNTERKRNNKRNKKKKALVVTVDLGAAVPQEVKQSKSASENQLKSASENQSKSASENQSKSASENRSKSASENRSKSASENWSKSASENRSKSAAENQSRSTTQNDALPPPATPDLNPQEKYMLEKNYVILLDKKSAKSPKAPFHCKLCKYHCDNVAVVKKHIISKHHCKAMEGEAERVTMLNLPPPTPEQLQYLDRILKEEVGLHGLSDGDILARRNIATVLSNSIAEAMPGFTVRLYGSSASGFGLKKSDVNLELCVPPEKSPSKGLTDASNIIAIQAYYRNVERDFTAKIPAVQFIDIGTNLPCTLILCNNHSYKVAELFSKYASIDERVQALGVAFRLWAQRCRLDSAEAGMWPPYVFPLLLIYFLQQLRDPVLPVLHELVDTADVENASDIYLDPENLEQKWKSVNTMSLGELWLEMFRFYALDFDISGRIICVQQSSPLLRSGNMKTWAGKKIAVRDPFLPKRNVTRSMSAPASFTYCISCFRNTYKYFGILRTKDGPIFDLISVDIPKELSPNKETAAADKVIVNKNDSHQSFSKNDGTVMTVSELEEKLKNASLGNYKSGDSLVSVSLQKAQEIFSSFNSAYLHYEFLDENFVGNQKYPDICSLCQKEGHSKDQCKEEQLLHFDTTLPPLEECYRQALDELCAQILAKWAITSEELEIRKRIASDIKEYILQYYPTAKLDLFGSSCNGFGLVKSDIDICLTFTDSETGKEHDFVKVIEDLQDKLKKFGVLSNLVPITTAKVPILKFHHAQSKLEGDISIYNILGQQNTKLLRTYAEIDPRFKMLGYMLKRFAKVCDMCDASRGSLSSYAYILMVIYFLQQCYPPVLPVLQELSETKPKPQRLVDDCDTYFYDNLTNLKKLWPEYGQNISSVGELWIQLLRFYSAEFDFGTYVISIRQKERLPRFEKLWTSKCMAIEDPFDLSHNLGIGLSRNMHVYIVKSFRKGYVHFGTSPADVALMTKSPEEYYFKSEKLTSGNPPNDRGCRICKKIGHLCKDCPQKRQGRQKRTGHRIAGGVGRRHPESSPVNGPGKMWNFNPMNASPRGYNPPYGLPHGPMHGAHYGRGMFHSTRELPPYRGGYNPVRGNFRAQDPSGMRYGMPHASPPFKPHTSSLDMSRKIGASGLPPFGRVRGSVGPVFGNEQISLIDRKLPVGSHVELRTDQGLQECYKVAHRLGLIKNKNLSRDLNHLKPKGEIRHVPNLANDIVVMDFFPHSQR